MTVYAFPSSALLQSGMCASPFTSLESPTAGPPLPFTVCTLDIDSDNNVTEGPVQQLMPLSPQNITLNPPEQIVMEVSSSLPLGFGEWSMGGVRITQLDRRGRFVGRVSINETASTSRLIIFPTNYGDSGVYQFSDVESEFLLPPVNFYISLPPRDIASEFVVIHSQHWHIFVLHWYIYVWYIFVLHWYIFVWYICIRLGRFYRLYMFVCCVLS